MIKIKTDVSPFPAKAHWSSTAGKPQAMEGNFKLTASQTCCLTRSIKSSLQKQQGQNSVLFWLLQDVPRSGSWVHQFVPFWPLLDRMCFPDLFWCDTIRLYGGLITASAPRSSPLWLSGGCLFITSHCVPFMRPPRRNSCLILVPRRVVILLSNSCFYLMDTRNCVRDMVSFSFWLRESLGTNWSPTHRRRIGHPRVNFGIIPESTLSSLCLFSLSFPSYCIIENWEHISKDKPTSRVISLSGRNHY